MSYSKMDQTRIAVAAFGDKTYTSTDIRRAMGDRINISLCLREMHTLGEIEQVKRGRDCRSIYWRTIKLRPVRQPKATTPQPTRPARQPAQIATHQTKCALRLHYALDNITRMRLAA